MPKLTARLETVETSNNWTYVDALCSDGRCVHTFVHQNDGGKLEAIWQMALMLGQLGIEVI